MTRLIDADGRVANPVTDIAAIAGMPYTTVHRWLAYMRDRRMLEWIQQAEVGTEPDGRTTYRRQIENEYVLRPPEDWVGYSPDLEPPVPALETWGATPALPGADTDDTATEAKARAELKAALDRLGRAVRGRGGG